MTLPATALTRASDLVGATQPGEPRAHRPNPARGATMAAPMNLRRPPDTEDSSRLASDASAGLPTATCGVPDADVRSRQGTPRGGERAPNESATVGIESWVMPCGELLGNVETFGHWLCTYRSLDA